MKFKYYLFLAKKSFLQKKINILNIFLLVISMTTIIVVSSFSKTFTNLIDNQVNGNINYRILLVHNITNIDELNDIENIDYVADYNSYSHYVTTEKGESLNLIGVPDNYLKILKGNNLSDVEERYTMICPSQFYLGADSESYDKSFLNNLHDGNEFLNKSFILKSLNYEEKYKIIGIFDVNSYTYGDYNVCFTTQNNILEIYKKEIEQYKKECDSEKEDCSSIGVSNSAIVVVSNTNELDNTQKIISDMGYLVVSLGKIDTTGVDFIVNVLIVIALIVMVITFIILLVYNNKFIQYNKKNNLIYMALGYDDKKLIKVNYLESCILSIISFLITLLICFIIYIVLNNIFIADIKTGCPICISYFSILMSFIFVLFVSLLSIYISLKNSDNSIIGGFVDEEI